MSEKLYVKRGDKYIGIGEAWFDVPVTDMLKDPHPEQALPPQSPQQAAETAGEIAIDVVEFGLMKRTDAKYQLELYCNLANGSIGKYPELRHVAEREQMWNMVGHLLDPYVKSPADLPIRAGALWRAYYKLGKETPKGGRYKDLQRVELVF